MAHTFRSTCFWWAVAEIQENVFVNKDLFLKLCLDEGVRKGRTSVYTVTRCRIDVPFYEADDKVSIFSRRCNPETRRNPRRNETTPDSIAIKAYLVLFLTVVGGIHSSHLAFSEVKQIRAQQRCRAGSFPWHLWISSFCKLWPPTPWCPDLYPLSGREVRCVYDSGEILVPARKGYLWRWCC